MAAPRPRPGKGVHRSKKLSPRLSIVYRDIEELKADPKNPRLHSQRQVRQIAESIKAFGFNVPLLVDRHLRLIAGHGRLAASRLLGIQRVPTLFLEHLNEHQVRAFALADNRLSENSSWDNQLLAEQFKVLSEVDLDFSLETTGFSIGEIDVLIEGLAPAPVGEEDPADDLPDIESAVRVAQAGDLWLLGRNRLVCGDALDEQTYSLLMDGRRADAVFTDPPYNLELDGYVCGFGKIHHSDFKVGSGEMSEAEFTEFLTTVLRHLGCHATDGSLHYVCMDWRHMSEMLAAGGRVYTEFLNLCIWSKGTGGQGSFYRSAHELIFLFKNGKGRHRNNVQLGQYGRYRTNVWQYPRVNSFGRATEEGNLAAFHPTIKPVALVADAILDCTARGQIVLDSFLGSGTALIATERTGRICYGIELDPKYVDVAIRRWQTFTGQTAIHERSGHSYRELEEVSHGRKR